MSRLRHSSAGALRVSGVLALGLFFGYTFAIFPATIGALLIGPLDESKWWLAGVVAAAPYLLVAVWLVALWRRGTGREHPLMFSFGFASLLSASGSSALFFLATLDSQF
jgi:hypothetical protein